MGLTASDLRAVVGWPASIGSALGAGGAGAWQEVWERPAASRALAASRNLFFIRGN